MFPAVTFQGSRSLEAFAAGRRPAFSAETAEGQATEPTAPSPVQPVAASAETSPRERDPEHRPEDRQAHIARERSEQMRESTRPVTGNPHATARKMRQALNQALRPPVSSEDARAAARAARQLQLAESEMRRAATTATYSPSGAVSAPEQVATVDVTA